MSILSKVTTIFRGDVPFFKLPTEVLRRRRLAGKRLKESANLDKLAKTPASLSARFGMLTPAELLHHFQQKPSTFFPNEDMSKHVVHFPNETARLIESADGIVNDFRWDLAGFTGLKFDGENVWRRDPLGNKDWGLDYHADVRVFQDDGSDIRVLWDLNRLGHAVTLAQAFAITSDEKYAETFFSHIDEWMLQNPYGRGANWNSAMEVALRAINLLAAFDIFRGANACTQTRLRKILQLFDGHGRFILDNNEFSYISTSNHYLSNVVGLFWIGTFLPELEKAKEWREFGLGEMLGEMDKQISPDGSDFEASTGYHKFVTEMLLYSFLLADRNGIEIDRKYWNSLAKMLTYIHGVMRPDGRAPLIGDADGSQIIPLVRRDADDAAYLLGIGAVVFNRQEFKEAGLLTPELLWIMGEKGVKTHGHLAIRKVSTPSAAFPDAGSYVLRDDDLYLHFNANDCGVKGRGSHAHNDALSIEVSAFGRPFIVDPGSYVYNLDRAKRQLFRSTGYHSTVMVDGLEQNTTDENLPFIIGNEARPKVMSWKSTPEADRIEAEHFGYMRLPNAVRHKRTVEFNKAERSWIIEDLLDGTGEHEFSFRFHLAPGIKCEEIDKNTVQLIDDDGRSLYIRTSGIDSPMELLQACVSRNYGHKEESKILKWDVRAKAPFTAMFMLVPSASGESRRIDLK